MKFSFKPPRWRNPFGNPVHLTKLHRRFFGRSRRPLTWRKVGVVSLWFVGSLVLLTVFLFAWFAKDLPTPNKIRSLVSAGSTRLYDRNMIPLYTISGEKKRILLEADEIPDIVRQATIALEDRDFYQHPGINVKAVTRALLVDIFTRRFAQGGSTITQQLVKNTILTKEKTLARKLKEVILAVELEILYSKDEILNMYLNQIPYGGNNYGIEAAARSFFGKSAKDLTLAEAATLAALPQAPTTLSPYGPNVERLIKRRNFTLTTMAELGYITKEEAEAAKVEKPQFAPRRESITAPHFVLYVKEWLVDFFTKELGDRQLAEQRVEEGGLSVVTTLDLGKQKIAEEVIGNAVATTLRRAGASNAALVTVDPKRGEVVAMVGSIDYFEERFGAFNVATAARQPGSSFKPIVYATAFKERYNPAFTLFDLRTDFGNYVPDNFDGSFRGPVTMRQALANSLNIPAVKTLGLIGLEKALKTAQDMGITTLKDKDRYGLALVLGGGEVEPLEMATAYGVFANNGLLLPTTPVLKITDSRSRVLYDHTDPKDGRVVLDPQIAYQISHILSDVEARRATFGRVNMSLPGRPSAVKTGTTNAYRDAWTIGYTPQYATAVWAGNNDNTPMNRGSGAIVAVPIWQQYMARIHQDLPVEQFVRPSGIQEIAVDRLSNKLPHEGSNVVTDIFARHQIPTSQDDVNQRIRVCKENGLLADSSIPDELAEWRIFRYVRSEKPDNPNWEGPVRAWAAAHGYNERPPTERCQIGDVRPSVSITSPTNNQEVSGVFAIAAVASAPSGIKSVEFLIDGISVATIDSPPYSTTYNANNLSSGEHRLIAVATSNNGSTASTEIRFKVKKDTAPPGNVASFSCSSQGLGSRKVTLSWQNPTDPDFKLVRIYSYFHPTGNQALTPVEVAKPSTSVILTMPVAANYKFVAKSVDESGNESSGVEVICFVS